MRRRYKATGVVSAALGAIGASWFAMRSAVLEERERALAVRMRRPRGPVVDTVVSSATDLGSVFAVSGLAAVLALTGRRRAAVDTFVAGSLAWAAAQAMKRIVKRPRPYQVEEAERLVSEPAGSSFPSGHPAVAAAVATVLVPHLPPGGGVAGGSLAMFVAASRVYVGVHYPTDVVAGLGLGGLSGATWRLVVGELRD